MSTEQPAENNPQTMWERLDYKELAYDSELGRKAMSLTAEFEDAKQRYNEAVDRKVKPRTAHKYAIDAVWAEHRLRVFHDIYTNIVGELNKASGVFVRAETYEGIVIDTLEHERKSIGAWDIQDEAQMTELGLREHVNEIGAVYLLTDRNRHFTDRRVVRQT